MAQPYPHPKPDLSRFQTRVILSQPTKPKLEAKLHEWMTEVVNSTKHPHKIRGMEPATFLTKMADGVDAILSTPTSMKIGQGNAKLTIYARFDLAGLPDGNWYVTHVKFGLNQSDLAWKAAGMTDAERQELRKRILERVAAAHKVHPKTLSFKAELHTETWQTDIRDGAGIIQSLIDSVYVYAKKAGSIPDNPYGPKDIALGLAGPAVGALGKTEERAEKLAKLYEYTDKVLSGVEVGKGIVKIGEKEKKGNVLAESQRSVYQESKGDKVAEVAIEVISNIPGAGAFVKGFAGMFFDFASANYAGQVTRIRGRAYSWFIAGFIQGITGVKIDSAPKLEIDDFFFQQGNVGANRMLEAARFQAQIFLLWYSSEHYVSGDSAGYKITRPDEWTFPDGYLAHWSPERLGLAFATLLKRKEYLVD